MAQPKPKKLTLEWWPQPRQIEFLRACGLSHPFDGGGPGQPAAKVIGLGGAAGGGKSDSLLLAGIIACLTWPRCNVGYFRREYPQLEGPGGAIMRSHELLAGIAKWNGTQRRWTFPNGGVIQFCHAKEENDVYSYQSQQFDVLLFDEGTQFTRFQYRYLLTRNRATVKNITPFMAIGTNPGNVGHLWFKTEFVDIGVASEPADVEVEPGRFEKHVFIPALLADNKILETRDPGYRQNLENQAEDIRRALLEGDWEAFSGQYFRDFSKTKHVIEPFEIPAGWRKFRSMDWGYKDPCVVLWHAVGPDRRVYTYRELHVAQTLASEVARTVKDISRGEMILYTVASPDAWAKRGNDHAHGESIADTFQQNGVPLKKADNSRIVGWQRVREFLAMAPDELPWWQVFNTCKNLIRTLPMLVHDEHNVEDVDGDCEDHAPESLRYGLMSRPRPSAPDKPQLQGVYAYGELQMMGYTDGQIKRLSGVKIIGGGKERAKRSVENRRRRRW